MALEIKKELLEKDPNAYVSMRITLQTPKSVKGRVGSFTKVLLKDASQEVLKYLKDKKGIDYIVDKK